MDAVIISCGTELVTGQCVDTNSAWLSAQLTPLGVRVVEHVTVGDDVTHLASAIRRALDGASLVILTGGLGPTLDDVAREAVAAALGEPLEENSEALVQVRAFFDRWQRPMPESNRRQAMIPRGCEVIPNPRGTAPGIRYSRDDRHLYVFPGIPAEMQAMFSAAVLPRLRAVTGGATTESARLLCFGISEAKLGELLADLMQRGRNPSVGTTASQAILSVRILSEGGPAEEARRLLQADVAEVRRRLGTTIFGEGEDTLESVVARLLVEHGKTIATAESCTGGLLSKRLTDIPGSSAYFLRGYVTYADAAKVDLLAVPADLVSKHGAVSEPVAGAMALGCRRAAGSDYAISITGIAGPTGGSPPEKPIGLVYIGLAHSTGVETLRVLCGDHLTREEIRDRSCKTALNLLRLRLLGVGSAEGR
jgi:nicotinamide-nucleotide amidase